MKNIKGNIFNSIFTR